jgi:hypothetical protein
MPQWVVSCRSTKPLWQCSRLQSIAQERPIQHGQQLLLRKHRIGRWGRGCFSTCYWLETMAELWCHRV